MVESNQLLIAGSTAGIIADGLTHPMCTIKARLMCQGAAGADVEKYNGLFQALFKIVKKEGWKTLYGGFGIVLLLSAPAQGLYFTGYELTRKILGNFTIVNFLSGFIAQICGSLTWVPMEVVKAKMMIQGQIQTQVKYNGSFDLVRKVVSAEGIRGVYRGFILQQFNFGPFNAFSLMFYNEFKKLIPKNYHNNSAVNFINSLSAYGISAFITNGFDVIQTRIQVSRSNPEIFNYKNGFDCAVKLIKNEGVKAYFSGVSGRVSWLTPRGAIAMTGFEKIMSILKKQNIQH